MPQSTCSIDGCDRPRKSRGWCHTHYQRWLRWGDPAADVPIEVPNYDSDVCAVDGCGEPRRARGWCNKHYLRWSIHGSPTGGGRLRDGTRDQCTIDGCERPQAARGWCDAHYRRWRRGAPIGDASMRKVGSGDDVGYNTAHRRVAEAKGRAAEHDCVWCGKRADEWAYDHTDPNPRFVPDDAPRGPGMPYSLDPARYQPMCKFCHKALDGSKRRESVY
jgi:hypothetical protein